MEVKVPQLPESVADATLVAWHRKVGESVRRDENLVDLETDKVVLEVPAPADGVLREIRMADGATVTSGEVLAVIEPGATGAAPGATAAGETPAPKAEPSPPVAAGTSDKAAGAASPAPAAVNGGSAPKMGPAVRKLIDEHDLDPSKIEATGNRLTKSDVLDYLQATRASAVGVDHDAGPGSGDAHEPVAAERRCRPLTTAPPAAPPAPASPGTAPTPPAAPGPAAPSRRRPARPRG